MFVLDVFFPFYFLVIEENALEIIINIRFIVETFSVSSQALCFLSTIERSEFSGVVMLIKK